MSVHDKSLSLIIDNFVKAKVLVVGDLILDQFIWGDVSRISPEAPVPVVLAERESFMPGGAANVACNITALEGKAFISGVLGNDEWGKVLKSELKKKKVNTPGIFIDKKRKTSLKTRIVARHQQVVRVDREIIENISALALRGIIKYIKGGCDSIQAIIIEDYGKGVVIPSLIEEIVKIAKKRNIIVMVDPKEEHFSNYRGVSCITPNQHEASQATGIKIVDDRSCLRAGKKLLKKLQVEAVLITRGEQGMCLLEKGKKPVQISTRAKEVFDVSGAGDTVIAAFTLALASGADFKAAADISNYAAGIVVEKIGVGSCTRQELIKRITRDVF